MVKKTIIMRDQSGKSSEEAGDDRRPKPKGDKVRSSLKKKGKRSDKVRSISGSKASGSKPKRSKEMMIRRVLARKRTTPDVSEDEPFEAAPSDKNLRTNNHDSASSRREQIRGDDDQEGENQNGPSDGELSDKGDGDDSRGASGDEVELERSRKKRKRASSSRSRESDQEGGVDERFQDLESSRRSDVSASESQSGYSSEGSSTDGSVSVWDPSHKASSRSELFRPSADDDRVRLSSTGDVMSRRELNRLIAKGAYVPGRADAPFRGGVVTKTPSDKELKSYHKRGVVNVLAGVDVRRLASLSYESIVNFKENMIALETQGHKKKPSTFISEVNKRLISTKFGSMGYLTKDDKDSWERWSRKLLFSRLLRAYPPGSQYTTGSLLDRCRKIPCEFSLDNNFAAFRAYEKKITAVMEEFTYNKADLQLIEPQIIKMIMDKLKALPPDSGALRAHQLLAEGHTPKDLWTFFVKWNQVADEARTHFENATLWGGGSKYTGKLTGQPVREPKSSEQQAAKHQQSAEPSKCRACGNPITAKHTVNTCRFLLGNHPDANYSKDSWAYSEAGRKFKKAGKKAITWGKRLDGSAWQMPEIANKPLKVEGEAKKNKFKRAKGEERLCVTDSVSDDDTIVYDRTIPAELLGNDFRLTVDVLVDTGASQDNYISSATAAMLRAQQAEAELKKSVSVASTMLAAVGRCTGMCHDLHVSCSICKSKQHDNNVNLLNQTKRSVKLRREKLKQRSIKTLRKNKLKNTENPAPVPDPVRQASEPVPVPENLRPETVIQKRRVCSGFKGMCKESEGKITFDFRFLNERLQQYEVLKNINATVVDMVEDFVLGRPDVIENDMIFKLSDHFRKRRVQKEELSTHVGGPSTHEGLPVLGQPRITHAPSDLNLIYKKSELLTEEPDDDGIVYKVDHYLWEMEDEDIPDPVSNKTEKVQPHVAGPEQLQKSIRNLVAEFDEIFSETLRSTPAGLTPLELNVDMSKWQKTRNRLPARVQTRAKEYEIERQINKMLANNVIKPSQAAYYSQVHLEPKPDNKWRFCLDFRELNNCTESMSWPIPNVLKMLQRLGHKRAKYYAVIDLTSGYHQAPLSKNSQAASAFITFMGTYEWLRVPMGLKSAPSYFQQQMATIVLRGLLYHICELYLDDIIVYGETEEEFLKNLRTVFDRLQKHGVTLNPAKCKLGVSEVQYVGHTINEEGLTFSAEKRHEVLEFPKPVTHRHMKQFLGLANYFRDHVRNHSIEVQPLQNMVTDYKRGKPLAWTPELEAVFEETKIKISQCPSLSFLDDDLPIFLHTDASDYGIGAYLFQLTPDGIEKPIAFVSKSLAKERLRWSVPEKEAFAIYYAFQKLEYLIRDVHFTLRTDHKNLTYVNQEGSAKVKRWKLALQEFDFDIEHIAGEKNVVADAFSRLVQHEGGEEAQFLAFSENDHIPRDKYKLISKVHNSTAGHNGVEKTLDKLAKQGTEKWQYMREHVKRFIHECPICQKLSHRDVVVHTAPFTTAEMEPMDTLNIDSINGLTADVSGNTSILVVICCFTRFVELYPIPNLTAAEAAKCLLEHIGRYGAPRRIRSDNGSQFANETIAELLKLVGTEHQLTLAYSSEENAIVERANKEVMRHLRAILLDFGQKDDWSVYLPLVQRIMNASEHSAIGVSPAQLIFGNSVTLDRGIFLTHKKKSKFGETKVSMSEWAENMLQKQAEIMQIARKSQEATDDYHIKTASAERTEFPINSYVLAKYRVRPPTKSHSTWRGPMRVIKFKGSTYTVQDLVTNKEEDYHVTQLKAFKYDVMEVDPVEIARKEQDEFVVEKVLEHRGNPKRRKTLQFLIQWLGYDQSENSWQSWENVKNNEVLNRYLYSNQLRSIMTPEQKHEVETFLRNEVNN